MRRTLLLAATLFLASSNTAGAQSYADIVWTQLQSAYDVAVGDDDYTLVNYIVGTLEASDSDYWSFPLEAGSDYFILAACDGDCSDVDLFVRLDGDMVTQDVATDDVPVLRFTPKTSGVHQIEVEMFECSASFCAWGMGLFKK